MKNFRGGQVPQAENTLVADNAWLASLPPEARRKLLDVVRVKRYPTNAPVHRKGGKADGLYGLLAGEIRVSASTYSGDEIVFTRLQPGQWFGEIALLDGGVRTHDSHTLVASEIAILPRAELLAVSARYAAVHAALVALLCQHCRQAFSAIDEFLVYGAAQRMARRLLELMPNSVPNKVVMSQADLGGLVGVSRQSTNKILADWQSRAWIKRVYRGIEILDAEALQRLAQ